MKKSLKSAMGLILAFVLTFTFTTGSQVKSIDADDLNPNAFVVSLSTNDSVTAGSEVEFQVRIQNTMDRELNPTIYTWYYQEKNNSEEYPGVQFGSLAGESIDIDEFNNAKITLAANSEILLSLTGIIPDTWNDLSQISVVVNAPDDGCMGQGDYASSDTQDIPGESQSEFIYETVQDGYGEGIRIIGYTGTDPEVIIPSEIDGAAVRVIGNSAFKGCTSIEKLTISEGVFYIEESAFANCVNLQTIELPASLDDIGPLAFVGCSIEQVLIAEGSNFCYVDGGLFTLGDMSSLVAYLGKDTAYTVPEGITTIGFSALEGSTVQALTVPSSVKTIWPQHSAGEYNYSLQELHLQGKYYYLEQAALAFADETDFSTLITTVYAPEGSTIAIGTSEGSLVYLREYFANKSLADHIIAEGVAAQEEEVTVGTGTSIPYMLLLPYNDSNSLFAGITAAESGKYKIAYPADCSIEGFTDSEGQTVLPAEEGEYNAVYALEAGETYHLSIYHWYADLANLDAPISITYLEETGGNKCGANAVWELVETEEGSGEYLLIISGSGEMYDYMSEIGNAPWYDQRESITGIVVEDGISLIGPGSFADCSNVKSAVLPASVETIGSMAFSGCTSLEEIAVPESVTGFGYGVFDNCSSLKKANIPDGITLLPTGLFNNCSSLEEITIPLSVTDIAGFVFGGCTDLKIYYPETESYWDAHINEGRGTDIDKNQISFKEPSEDPEKISIETADITVAAATFNGKERKPSVVVELDGKTLQSGTDYTASYSNNINAGPDAKVTITGIGKYEGSVEKQFVINKAQQKLTIEVNKSTIEIGSTAGVTVYGHAGTLSFSSSDDAIAEVDKNGMVKAKKTGTATITVKAKATSNYYSGSGSVTITVKLIAQSITAKAAKTTLDSTKSTTITVTGAKGTVSYASSDKTIATVSAKGVVTAKLAGTATITVKAAAKGNYAAASKKIKITVTPLVTASPASVENGRSTFIIVRGSRGSVSYKSSNTKVAAVSSESEDHLMNGTTAMKRIDVKATSGTATITVTFAETKYSPKTTKNVKITATKGPQLFSALPGTNNLVKGKTTKITVKDNKGKVTYKSSNTAVATVSSTGVIKGIKAGTAVITVSAAATTAVKAGSKKINIKVTDAAVTVKSTEICFPLPKTIEWWCSTYEGHGGNGHAYSSIDIRNKNGGTWNYPVYAVEGGKVTLIDPSNGQVQIKHSTTLKHSTKLVTTNGITYNTWYSTYAHMRDIQVTKNAEVEKGQVIGYVSSVGNSTGPHLHFSMSSKVGSGSAKKNAISPYYVRGFVDANGKNTSYLNRDMEGTWVKAKLINWKPQKA